MSKDTPGHTENDRKSPSELREVVTGVWQDVLRLDGLAPDANFFELGGHSLTASQVISRLRHALGAELPLAAFFDHPTIAEQADHLAALERTDAR
ncbi:phosphopantetheine-binding protein [Kitasatospora viridis]|uniref:phosphopantetheine-binding protein n=1 Tax=Kitasatospora viridis TaxID=281105 RepID=UPI001FE37785|nr:phosphopantetheine-binding protein [Kitasatospora viridis]